MSRHIEATPALEGEDAERLIEDLKNVCSSEESERRTRWAHLWLMRQRPTAELEQELSDIQAELARRYGR